MNQLIRLFCLETDPSQVFSNNYALIECLEELKSEFHQVDFNFAFDYIFWTGKNLYKGRQFIGPLKPEDSKILEKGFLQDLRIIKKGQVIGLEEMCFNLENLTKAKFLMKIDLFSTSVQVTFCQEEDIDL